MRAQGRAPTTTSILQRLPRRRRLRLRRRRRRHYNLLPLLPHDYDYHDHYYSHYYYNYHDDDDDDDDLLLLLLRRRRLLRNSGKSERAGVRGRRVSEQNAGSSLSRPRTSLRLRPPSGPSGAAGGISGTSAPGPRCGPLMRRLHGCSDAHHFISCA